MPPITRQQILDRLFDSEHVGIGAIDPEDGRCALANDAFARIFDYASVAQCLADFHSHRHLSDPLLEEIRRAALKGVPTPSVEEWVRTRSEDSRRVRFTARPLGVDEPVAVLLVDVTDMTQAMDRLRESEGRFRALVDGSFDGLTLVADGRMLIANQVLADMLGREVEELVGESPLRFVAPEYRHMVQEHLRQGGNSSYEIMSLRKDGTPFPMAVWGRRTTYRGRSARFTRLRDLTADQATQRSLDESRIRYRELTEMLPIGVAETDRQGCLTFLNRACLQIYGFQSEAEALGRPIAQHVVPEEIAGMRAKFADRLAGMPTTGSEYTLIRADGSTFRGLVYAAPIHLGGRAVGVRAAIIDVTDRAAAERERQRLQAQMLHAQKLESIGVLAGGIAHDFNNLLAIILCNTDLALSSLDGSARAEAAVQQIRLAAERAAGLTRQMLAYSGRGGFALEAVDLNTEIRQLTELLQASVSKKATLICELSPALPAARADAAQITQVVLNLVTNASEALSDRPGEIRIRADLFQADRTYLANCYVDDDLPGGEYIRLSVTDTGEGMDEATCSRIFDPFFTTKGAGRGLGLGAVLGIVRGHRGAIRVTSEPGEGTQITVLLPPAAAPIRERSAAPAAHGDTGRCARVLLCEDEHALADVARQMLERLGHDVQVACDGAEAVSTLTHCESPFDLLLLDRTMPNLDGIEVLAWVREHRRGLPVVLMSGYADLQGREDLDGVSAVLRKPYDFEALRATVTDALDRSRPTGVVTTADPERR